MLGEEADAGWPSAGMHAAGSLNCRRGGWGTQCGVSQGEAVQGWRRGNNTGHKLVPAHTPLEERAAHVLQQHTTQHGLLMCCNIHSTAWASHVLLHPPASSSKLTFRQTTCNQVPLGRAEGRRITSVGAGGVLVQAACWRPSHTARPAGSVSREWPALPPTSECCKRFTLTRSRA